ncbi:hypothetical protein Ndes2526B_g01910 [Nannochloris sp. 'desiccata']
MQALGSQTFATSKIQIKMNSKTSISGLTAVGSKAPFRPISRGICRTKASSEELPSTSTTSQDDDLLIERQMAKRRPKANPKTPTPPAGSYKVISAQRDQVYSDGPLTDLQKFETNIIYWLGFLFCVILGEGIFLAGSGFMSVEADQFAQDVVYPAFSPTLGLFLLSSSLYGLWKTGAGRKEGDDKKE